jgi:hypothetical protein
MKCWLATNNEIPFPPNEKGETPELGIKVTLNSSFILVILFFIFYFYVCCFGYRS